MGTIERVRRKNKRALLHSTLLKLPRGSSDANIRFSEQPPVTARFR